MSAGGVDPCFAQLKARRDIMQTYFRHAAVALALAAGTQAAGAQTWITREPVLETQTIIAGQPLQLTPAQRTTIYRTIVPQGRGRAPIVRERIITEPVAPAPIVRERTVVVGRPAYTRAPAYSYRAPIAPYGYAGYHPGYSYAGYDYATDVIASDW